MISSIQAAILRDGRALPGANQNTVAWHVRGPITEAGMRAAWGRVLRRHPLLASTFAGNVRLHHPDAPAPVRFVDVGGPDATRAWLAANVPAIDADVALPLDVTVARVGPDEHVIRLVLHHVCYDAVSIAAVSRDMSAALMGEPIATDWVDYERFVEAERAWLAGPAYADTLEMARAEIAGRPLRLPVAPGAVGVQHVVGRRWSVDALVRAGEGTAPLPTLLAGWSGVVANWLGTHDVVFGTTVALRPRGLERVFGPAFQYVPAFPEVHGSFVEARAAARTAVRRALRRAWIPLAELGPTGLGLNANVNFYDMDRAPDVAMMAGFRGGGVVEGGGLQLREWALAEATLCRPYDLNLAAFKLGGVVAVSLRYRPDLLDAQAAGELLDLFGARVSSGVHG